MIAFWVGPKTGNDDVETGINIALNGIQTATLYLISFCNIKYIKIFKVNKGFDKLYIVNLCTES